MHNMVETLKQQIASLDTLATGKTQTLTALADLQRVFNQKDIEELIVLVQSMLKGNIRKLDTQLWTPKQDSNNPVSNNGVKSQQPNNNDSSDQLLGNNGHRRLSMNDLIRLNLLKSATTNMMSRMSVPHY